MADLKNHKVNIQLDGNQIETLLDMIADKILYLNKRIFTDKNASKYDITRKSFLEWIYGILTGHMPDPNKVGLTQRLRVKRERIEAWKAKKGYNQSQYPPQQQQQSSQPVQQQGPYSSDYMNRQTAPNNSPQVAPQSPDAGYTPVYPPPQNPPQQAQQPQPQQPPQQPVQYAPETPFPPPSEGQKNTAPVQTYDNPPPIKDSDLPPL